MLHRQKKIGFSRPRIAIVTSIHPDYDPRIWKHAVSLANRGYEIHLICPWPERPENTLPNLVFLNFKRVKLRILRPFLVPVRVLAKLLPVLSKVDIVHFHDLDLLPWLAIVSARKPVVYDIHENYPDEMLVRHWIPDLLRWPLYHAVKIGQNMFARIIHNAVIVAPSQLSDLEVDKLRIVEIPNYVSVDLLNTHLVPYRKRPQAVIFTGGHYKENGSFLIVEIAAELKSRGRSIPFILTDRADPSTRRDLDRAISERGLSKLVRFVPSVPSDRINEILSLGSIGIAPNLRVPKQVKAIPTKIFEYMAASMPIVASDLPYIRRFVGEANAGILADPEKKSSFVDAILTLLEDEDLGSELGANGRRAIREHYNWEKEVPKLMEFYDSIVARESG
jgi:glycosyltransferase involved in cell wall biosynthesis